MPHLHVLDAPTGIGAVPIVDAEGRVVGIYSRSDITFLATAADPEAVLEVWHCIGCPPHAPISPLDTSQHFCQNGQAVVKSCFVESSIMSVLVAATLTAE